MRVKMTADHGIDMNTRSVWMSDGEEYDVSDELAEKLFRLNRAVPVVEDKVETRANTRKKA